MIINEIVCDDALSYLSKLKDESVDLILTDPAYDSMNKWRGVGTTARMGMGEEGSGSDDRNKFFETIPNSDIYTLMSEFYRVLKPSKHTYVFCDYETLKIIESAIDGVWPKQRVNGVEIHPLKPLIWDKQRLGMGYTYRARYEFIAFLWKGKKQRLNDLGISDILNFKRISSTKALVPTQKPNELFELLIQQSTQEKELVLDPFMGSGTTARASKKLNRNYIGCDINEKHVRYSNGANTTQSIFG